MRPFSKAAEKTRSCFAFDTEHQYWAVTVQSVCRVKKISMTSIVLPLHFTPKQASSSQNSNVDDTLEGYKIKFALPYKIFSTLLLGHCKALASSQVLISWIILNAMFMSCDFGRKNCKFTISPKTTTQFSLFKWDATLIYRYNLTRNFWSRFI